MDNLLLRPRLYFGVLSAVLMFSACSGSTAEDVDSAANPDSFTTVALKGQNTQQTHAFIEEAINACMEAEGFDYELMPFEPTDTTIFDSREIREEKGFGISLGTQGATEQVDQGVVEANEGSTPEEVAGYASQESECSEEANEELNVAVANYIDSLDQTDRAAFDAVSNFDAPQLVEAEQNWATCIQLEGFDFSSPGEMYEFANSNFSSESDLDDEIALSLADWDCSKSNNVQGLIDEAYNNLDSQLADGFNESVE